MKNMVKAFPEIQPPLYIRIEESLREMIAGIEFEPGDQIPSERELAEKFNASRMTVRRVVENLTAQGYLERRSTRGTFVSVPEVTRTFNSTLVQSLTRQVQGKGGVIDSKLLTFDEIPVPIKVAKLLQLKSEEMVFFIQRLRLTGGLPFCIEYSYLPKAPFKELTKEKIQGQSSLYKYLKQRYGLIPSSSSDKLNIAWPTETEAKHLGLSMNDPVLYLRSLVFSNVGTPFELVKSINHPQRVAFQSETNTDAVKR